MLRRILPLTLLAAAALLGALFWTLQRDGAGDRFASCRSGSVIAGGAQIGGPFTLVSETGEEMTDAEVFDRPALLYFGYTFCPSICPYDAARNAEAASILGDRGESVKPVFVSVDPERDTPAKLASFTDFMHPDMLGLTGSAEQVDAAKRAYRVFSRRHDADDMNYLVDHSTFTYLVMPQTGFAEFFRRSVPAREMADRVQCFLDAA